MSDVSGFNLNKTRIPGFLTPDPVKRRSRTGALKEQEEEVSEIGKLMTVEELDPSDRQFTVAARNLLRDGKERTQDELEFEIGRKQRRIRKQVSLAQIAVDGQKTIDDKLALMKTLGAQDIGDQKAKDDAIDAMVDNLDDWEQILDHGGFEQAIKAVDNLGLPDKPSDFGLDNIVSGKDADGKLVMYLLHIFPEMNDEKTLEQTMYRLQNDSTARFNLTTGIWTKESKKNKKPQKEKFKKSVKKSKVNLHL